MPKVADFHTKILMQTGELGLLDTAIFRLFALRLPSRRVGLSRRRPPPLRGPRAGPGHPARLREAPEAWTTHRAAAGKGRLTIP